MNLLWKGLLAVFWLIFVPGAAGIPFLWKKENRTFKESFLAGYLFLFSAAELLTLPMLYGNLSLNVLTVSFGAVALLAGAVGIFVLLKNQAIEGKKQIKQAFLGVRGTSFYLYGAILLIAAQIVVMVLFAHMDADDSFYVGTATSAVETNTIFSVNPYTGMDYRVRPSRYVLSPFPVFLAVVSQLCGGLHPAIMAHVIFPAVFLLFTYLILYQFGKKWFPGEKDAQGIFLLLCAVFTWFSAYSIYTAGNFQMVRLWQGKALLACAMIPLVIYLSLNIMMKKKPEYSWLLLGMADISCCLLSSMGVLLCPIVIGVFCLVSLIWDHDFRKVGKGICCCIPSLFLGIAYILLQYL